MKTEVDEVAEEVNDDIKPEVDKVKDDVEKIKPEIDNVKDEIEKIKPEVETILQDLGMYAKLKDTSGPLLTAQDFTNRIRVPDVDDSSPTVVSSSPSDAVSKKYVDSRIQSIDSELADNDYHFAKLAGQGGQQLDHAQTFTNRIRVPDVDDSSPILSTSSPSDVVNKKYVDSKIQGADNEYLKYDGSENFSGNLYLLPRGVARDSNFYDDYLSFKAQLRGEVPRRVYCSEKDLTRDSLWEIKYSQAPKHRNQRGEALTLGDALKFFEIPKDPGLPCKLSIPIDFNFLIAGGIINAEGDE